VQYNAVTAAILNCLWRNCLVVFEV